MMLLSCSEIGVVLRVLIIWFGLVLNAPVAATDEALSQEFIEMIPGGKIEFDMIVDLGFRYSDSAQLVKANLKSGELIKLRARANEAETLTAGLSQSADRNEQASPFAATVLSAQQISTGWQKSFGSGTLASAEVSSVKTDLSFTTPNAPPVPEYESRLSLSLRQSLWRNAFGRSQKAAREASQLRGKAITAAYEAELSQWLLNLHNLYAQAWLAQQRVGYADERIAIQKRLGRIIAALRARGTALESDSLLVTQNLLSLRQNLAAANLDLQDLWRRLIILLKLPKKFLELNPVRIPISLTPTHDLLADYCQAADLTAILDNSKPQMAALAQEISAGQIDRKALLDRLNPDLYLSLAAGANDWDDSLTKSLSRSLQFQNPDYIVALGLEIDLNQDIRDADLIESSLNLTRAELQLSSRKAEARILWTNTCAAVQRLLADKIQLEEIIKLGQRRSQLEENRFLLGKIAADSVIRASNELVANKEALALTTISLARAKWNLKDLKAEVTAYIDQAVSSSRISADE